MKANYILMAVLFFMATLVVCAQDEFTLAKKGEKAPDFSFEVKPGQTKKLSDLEGKVVLINFFATWCGPCRQELPHLEKEVYGKYKGNNDFELLIFGREHNWKTVDSFKVANNFSMPFYPDMGRKIFSVYAGQNIPRNFIIDKTGKIVYTSVGFTEEEFAVLKNKLAGLLR